MNLKEACFALLAMPTPDGECPVPIEADGKEMDRRFSWFVFQATMASMSGMLDDAESQADLREAIEHTRSLYAMGGIYSADDVCREVSTMLDTIADWELAPAQPLPAGA